MPVTAKIQFVQNFVTGVAGQAFQGVLTFPVQVFNEDNTNVSSWTFRLIDVPATSVLPSDPDGVGGIFQDGSVPPPATFIPDRRGGYEVELIVKDTAGNQSVDRRVFLVPEVSGRRIPPFGATNKALNFAGGKRGWAVIMEEWLHFLDSFSGGGNSKAAVRVATNAALPAYTPAGGGVGKTLTANAVGLLVVDGVTTNLFDRILVKDEGGGTSIHNGIYKVTTAGSFGQAFVLTRATDFDESSEVLAGTYLFSTEGTVNADEGWVLTTNDPITIDVTALTFGTFTSLLAVNPPANVTKSAAVTGVTSRAAREDHKHDVTTAAPVDIGTANAEGAASSLARSNHVHNLPFSAVQNALAAATANISVNSRKITSVQDPTANQDAATKFYVDSVSGGGSGVSTVANLAALTALSIVGKTDGGLAYVQTLKSYFLLDTTSALASDSITIVNTSGAGRWIRIKEVTHESWRRQAAWFIDPAGSDENDGLTGGTKLKTWDELFRRWGPKAFIFQNTTVTLSGNHPQANPVKISLDPKSGTLIRIKGTVIAGRAGALTGTTNRNRATNQPYVLADTGIANWLADVDNRIRITTAGPRLNTLAWVDKDVGGNAARFSEPNIPDAPNLFLTPKIPLVGDAYVVETLSKVFISEIDVQGDLSDAAAAPIVTIEDLTLDLAGSGFSDVIVGNSATYISISSCRFNCFFNQSFSTFSTALINCNFTKGVSLAGGAFSYILAGLIKGPTAFNAALSLYGACKAHLDNDVLVYGAFLDSGSTLGIGVAGFFDAIVGGQQNPAGSGIYTRPGCFIQQRESFTGSRNIWGQGNAGYGIHVGVFGAAAPKNTPTVTGALGDARLGGSTSGLAQDPVTGAYVGPFAYSWANFNTALPAGFGGNMVQVSHKAAINLEVL